MNHTSRVAGAVATIGLVIGSSALIMPADAHTTGIHDNCTELNKKWAHGVGKKGAVDQGGDVTTFKRSTKAYKRAVNHNSTLDRDKDGIACEKA